MFVFVGVVIALVQGGYVRRKAPGVGERAMAARGVGLVVPGLVAVALAHSSWVLYLGLLLLAVGSAMAIPCLTAMVSLYAPPESQGRSLGVFRGLGALARVCGPLAAGAAYWRWGPQWPYLLGAVFLTVPIAMLLRLPDPRNRPPGTAPE